MSKQSARDQVVSEVTEHKLGEATQGPLETYLRWCDTNNLSPLPAEEGLTGEQLLLVYLQSMTDDRCWNHEMMKFVAGVASRYRARA